MTEIENQILSYSISNVAVMQTLFPEVIEFTADDEWIERRGPTNNASEATTKIDKLGHSRNTAVLEKNFFCAHSSELRCPNPDTARGLDNGAPSYNAPDINTDRVDKAPVDGKLKRSLTKKEEIELLAKKKRLNLVQRYSMVDQGPNTESRKLQIELINYRSTPDLIDEHFNLFQYWKEKRACYPGLSNLARIVHCIPATSAEIECVWSLSGLVLSSRRSKLECWTPRTTNTFNIRAIQLGHG
ncbi:hypothetical protein ACHWQZ_G004280 [Mnemiopsis leidyi]